MSYLIKNGLIINSNGTKKLDIFIEDGIISKVGAGLTKPDDQTLVINAANKYIIPGGIDPHVHFHLKTNAGFTSDDFFSGSKAAIAGGTTTILDFVTPKRGQSLPDALQERLKDAETCICDYSFHVSPILYHENLESEMTYCIQKYGIQSFKVYMAYKETIGIDEPALEKILELAKKLNVLATIHAEDGDAIHDLQIRYLSQGHTEPIYHALSRPPETENHAVERAISLANKTGASIYFVHVSSGESIYSIAKAQAEGCPVYAETCPQYLVLDIEKLKGAFHQTAPYVFSPALREASHSQILWDQLSSGAIQTIGTDHCSFHLKSQKELGMNDFTKIPNGAGGVEHRLSLLFTYGVLQNKISLEQWVAITASQPARIFGLSRKGSIAEGYDADIVLWNPNHESTILAADHWQNCDTNIYEGMKVKGSAEKVWIRGNLVFDQGHHWPIRGEFLKRIPTNPDSKN
ncbi:MAG TPA: dihydropyrimidinase [Marinilabiliales bacterium]|jgi:dihydropyrimidinase|nr:MAG: dihydropyrimidinase [Bacteroidetes bacterium GWA2_40_14]OFX60872.1 MAG: dihydropyrimidinase [Bacteroidetes bacterium GWC2_40_13]OFX71526.1 MAG: dihydropyrimidinase [Bacteroidetes bacterium GWD2_40_43]OFX95560.1 MAG: dihydropyrimidinase [Bacteroidetes bacterium GWE2_40_63]OFY22282.1 MAG: dihydropyrimidinase [Bacteroidetes bacterium GWF2_40_13]OFZ24918.1 MAG: dihydropyrimidinase [Bacteroidetes bacterium RIFOXYC2_FULL_40_12]HAN00004.1 dihydropyrimidinase [Marinilabiliales bacterium]